MTPPERRPTPSTPVLFPNRKETPTPMDYANRLLIAALLLRDDLVARARRSLDERGSVTTEQAIVTAGEVVLALTAVGIVTALVLRKINTIDLDAPPPTSIP